jgi:hypothetical protein
VFHFGPTCPAYTEGISTDIFTQEEAYTLNCRAVGSIGPGESVRFAMQLQLPHRGSGRRGELQWTLAPHSWRPPTTSATIAIR